LVPCRSRKEAATTPFAGVRLGRNRPFGRTFSNSDRPSERRRQARPHPLEEEHRMTHFFTPVARSLAIASLTGAALLAGSLAPATAQTPDSQKPPAAAAATSSKPETVEQRITTLKAALKITPDQEPKWNGVAQAMRDNAVRMEKLVAEKRAIPPEKTTAIDDLKTYQEFAEAHLDGLKHLTSAFKTLYNAMTPDQKKNADVVFEKYTPPKSASQG
jgi:periplasmic protein CpxP/Spy